MAIWGVDVSAIQGVVPFDALAKQGARYAYLRCKVGNDRGIDPRFIGNAQNALANGIAAGAYCFAYPLPHIRPAEAAQTFYESTWGGGRHLGDNRGELPLALDLEWPPPERLTPNGKGWTEWGCSAPQIIDWALECLHALHLCTGYVPVLYSYPHFLKRLFADATPSDLAAFAGYPLWIAGGANYQNGAGKLPDLEKESPPLVAPWNDGWTLWQYDGNGGARLPNGVDADFNIFHGDEAAFRSFTGASDGQPSAPPPRRDAVAEANGHMLEDEIRAYRAARDFE